MMMQNDNDSDSVVTQSITVARGLEAAFRLWTEHIQHWWPVGHSMSGDPNTQIFIEGKVGGRFFERTTQGVEHDWGKVVVWEPPHRLAYLFYLGSGPQLPTRAEIHFVALDEKSTLVTVEHGGSELIGELWWQNQSRYRMAWQKVLPGYAALCASGAQ